MGTDKALVTVDGRAMAVRVADALRAGGCRPVWCQGGDAAGLRAHGLEVRADPVGRVGPVGAIGEVLASSGEHDGVVISACDLPCLDGDVVRALVEQRDRSGRVAVAVSGGRRHLLAAWPTTARPAFDELFAAGVRSYAAILERLDAVEVEVDDDVVRNVNRPDDLPS